LKITKNSPKARDFSQPEPVFPQAPTGQQLMQSNWAVQDGAYSAASSFQRFSKPFAPEFNNATAGGPGCVLLVNNIPPKITPNDLFTLFGVYGDVMRVKILYKKLDTALLQFASPQQAQLALLHLNRLSLLGKDLAIAVSKHNEVSLPKEGSAEYSQASSLTRDFTHSKTHRFSKSGRNARNINAPSQVLHISNLPDNSTEDQIRKLFQNATESKSAPVVQFFANNRKQCFARLESLNQAVVGLIRLHNHKMNDRYIRVSFSNRDPNTVTPSENAQGVAQDKKSSK
jgi:hnRNP-L/PTB/hephaestus splicing factor